MIKFCEYTDTPKVLSTTSLSLAIDEFKNKFGFLPISLKLIVSPEKVQTAFEIVSACKRPFRFPGFFLKFRKFKISFSCVRQLEEDVWMIKSTSVDTDAVYVLINSDKRCKT